MGSKIIISIVPAQFDVIHNPYQNKKHYIMKINLLKGLILGIVSPIIFFYYGSIFKIQYLIL